MPATAGVVWMRYREDRVGVGRLANRPLAINAAAAASAGETSDAADRCDGRMDSFDGTDP